MNTQNDSSNDNADIYERYVEDSSFLWMMRSIAVNQPHYNALDIKALENRMQAHLDGLLTSINMAWQICEKSLKLNGPGEVFTAAIVAFTSHDQQKIQAVVKAGLASNATLKGLISAIAWLPSKISHPWIQKFLISNDINDKYIGMSICSIGRENPGEFLHDYLNHDDCLRHEKLYIRCLRLIGELKRHDLAPALFKAMESDNADVIFWANWSAILLGNKTLVNKMEPYLFKPSSYQDQALNMAFRVLPINQARDWITRLSGDVQRIRHVIKATGIAGDPQAVDWLVLKMRETPHARLAGESFTLITGIDLNQNKLSQAAPEHVVAIPSENASDPNVAMDDDENLPWPNAALIAASWKHIAHQYIKGQRYFMGNDINTATLTHCIQHAYQRQRHAAALELALLDSANCLINTRAKIN